MENPEKISEKLIQIASHGPMWETTSHLMAQHYDASEAFFRSFLDSEYLAYSMAFYSENGATAATIEISLEEAQRNKFKTICKRAGLQGDEQILNIGCGFGSFERYLIENYPQLQITSITASTTQSSYINNARNDPAHPLSSKRFKLITGDFADLTEETLGQGHRIKISLKTPP
ncbi:MAG: class I SAM-dependent methyltransferase [gamma proteobacterium endosymbiont of Lamellibrachia anaximandri]|nr:class I SAM-dependent methyltransferase [gamma proteobacterium endosymbiont of Lamellibrachia anaximandri]